MEKLLFTIVFLIFLNSCSISFPLSFERETLPAYVGSYEIKRVSDIVFIESGAWTREQASQGRNIVCLGTDEEKIEFAIFKSQPEYRWIAVIYSDMLCLELVKK